MDNIHIEPQVEEVSPKPVLQVRYTKIRKMGEGYKAHIVGFEGFVLIKDLSRLQSVIEAVVQSVVMHGIKTLDQSRRTSLAITLSNEDVVIALRASTSVVQSIGANPFQDVRIEPYERLIYCHFLSNTDFEGKEEWEVLHEANCYQNSIVEGGSIPKDIEATFGIEEDDVPMPILNKLKRIK